MTTLTPKLRAQIDQLNAAMDAWHAGIVVDEDEGVRFRRAHHIDAACVHIDLDLPSTCAPFESPHVCLTVRPRPRRRSALTEGELAWHVEQFTDAEVARARLQAILARYFPSITFFTDTEVVQ
jgi:hypothetical protein